MTTTDSSTNFFVVLKLFFIMGPLWLGNAGNFAKKTLKYILSFPGEFFSHLISYRYGHENTFAIRLTLDLLPMFSVRSLPDLSNWICLKILLKVLITYCQQGFLVFLTLVFKKKTLKRCRPLIFNIESETRYQNNCRVATRLSKRSFSSGGRSSRQSTLHRLSAKLRCVSIHKLIYSFVAIFGGK